LVGEGGRVDRMWLDGEEGEERVKGLGVRQRKGKEYM
jgi:hypothetical protein